MLARVEWAAVRSMKTSRLVGLCVVSALFWSHALATTAADAAPCDCLNRLDKQVKAGKIGVAIHYFESGKELFINGDERFPLQSVFKAPLAVAVLREVDAHKLSLNKKVTITQNDVSVYHSPIRTELAGRSKEFTIAELVTRAVTEAIIPPRIT